MIERRFAALLALPAFASAQVRITPLERPPSAGPEAIVVDPPLARWDEGLPLGNGLLGAMVWGEGNVLKISLDRADLWDERMPPVFARPEWTYATLKQLVAARDEKKLHELFDQPYDAVPYPTKIPGGRVELVFPPEQTVRKFKLEPSRAEVTAAFGTARVRVQTSAKLPLTIVRVDHEFPQVQLYAPAVLTRLGYPPAKPGSEGALRWFVQKSAEDWSFAVVCSELRDDQGTTYAIALVRAAAGRDPVAQSRAYVDVNPTVSYDQLSQTFHIGWWHDLWQTSWLQLPDDALEAQHGLARYLYGAGSRLDQLESGGAPLALQGLWSPDDGNLPPWKGDYHNDLNTEATYLAYAPAGLFEQGECFLQRLVQLEPRFREFAKSFYGVDGLIVPGVMTLSGKATGGWAQYALSPTNTAWLAQLFHTHWKYTRDDEFLKTRAYPWCAAAGQALAALLQPAENGKARLPLSSSPEMFDASLNAWLSPDSNYDQALLQALYGSLDEMATALGKSDDSAKWNEVLGRLESLAVDSGSGALAIARGVPYADSHRHLSHAIAIHPLGLISIEGPEAERKLVLATLAQIEAKGTSKWTGYTFAWFACMCARAGLGDKALDYLTKYRAFTGHNGLHLNGDQSERGLSSLTYRPFSVEGTMLAAQAVHEMLLQSWGGVVRVFPATPESWKTLQYQNLRGEGALRISARRQDGVTQWVSVQADKGGQVRLRDPFLGSNARWSRENVHKEGSDYVAELAPGETLEGWPKTKE